MNSESSTAISLKDFQNDIRAGIPTTLPEYRPLDLNLNHAPKRKEILSTEEKKLALRNALRYFPKNLHDPSSDFAAALRRCDR